MQLKLFLQGQSGQSNIYQRYQLSRAKNFHFHNMPECKYLSVEPIEVILDRYHIMAGDFSTVRDNVERIIVFIGRIARDLSTNGIDLQEKLIKITEMAETLRIRIHYGIREELSDLVQRLDDVARVRARILYKAGYRTASQVKKEDPYTLNKKTGLGINLCKRILKEQ
ncbi:hypothetical protein LCGC14_0986730 [marine sediment metagenome]|uniref:Uncharacterized protein n=1 Tax=marine sediment metagenome TaxID=412755 RepID=A0A0F9NTK0_9ZZZZ